MATTQLFVELLIIGVGVAIWLGFLLAILLRFQWGEPLPEIGAASLTALLGTAYVLGILVDRAAYAAFHPIERRHRNKVFGENPNPSVDDRERFILVKSSSLREQILYNRSRLRICRSWILNFALISALSSAWALQQAAWGIALISLGALLLCFLTAYTANSLARDHCNNIRYSYEFLTKNEERGGDG